MTTTVRASAALSLLLGLAALAGRLSRGDAGPGDWVWLLLLCLAYAPAAALLARRALRLAVVFAVVAVAAGTRLVSEVLLEVAAERGWSSLVWWQWATNWTWAPPLLLLVAVLPALLPDGRAPARGPLALGLAATVLGTLGWALAPWDAVDEPPALAQRYGLTNPVGVEGGQVLLAAALPAAVLAFVLGTASLARRWRRAGDDEQQALAWVVLGLVATFGLLALGWVVPDRVVTSSLAALPLPAAVLVAVLRHGLYDVQLLLRRTVVWLVLSGGVVLAYVLVVGALGSVLGERTGAPAVVAAVVALGVAPLRTRLQRGVSHLLYGEASDPAAAVDELGRRLAQVRTPEDALAGAAAEVARALRLPGVALHVTDGPSAVSGALVGTPLRLPLVHAGAPVGELLASPRRPGEALRPRDEALLRALAVQAGAVAALARADAEVRRSREQVVAAREEERRRLRRDLHDSLGPTLAAVALQVEALPDLPPGALPAVSQRLTARVQGAVDDVRRLLEGLGPGVLDDLGLDEALRALGASLSTPAVPVHVDVPALPELPAAVEAAALRVAGEALTNAVRHARATRIGLHAAVEDDALVLRVDDDGVGTTVPSQRAGSGLGLGSLHEAAAEVGGTCEVRSAGGGTTVALRLPLGVRA